MSIIYMNRKNAASLIASAGLLIGFSAPVMADTVTFSGTGTLSVVVEGGQDEVGIYPTSTSEMTSRADLVSDDNDWVYSIPCDISNPIQEGDGYDYFDDPIFSSDLTVRLNGYETSYEDVKQIVVTDKGGKATITICEVDIERDVKVSTKGNGVDTVNIYDSRVTRNVGIYTLNGPDSITVHNVYVGLDLLINSGNNSDGISVQDTNARKIQINSGGGADFVRVWALYENSVNFSAASLISTGQGRDTVIVDGAEFLKRLTVSTGPAADAVDMNYSNFVNGVKLNSGRGNDCVSAKANFFGSNVVTTFDGAQGNGDQIDLAAITYDIPPVAPRFEIMTSGATGCVTL